MSFDVFISYSTPERAIAERICEALEANGVRCWMAPRDVAAASHYSGEIIRGLNQCRVVVLLVSPSSNRSWHVLREVERAVSKGKHILPVRLQEIELGADLEYFISVVHWLDAFAGIESKIQELEAAVRDCLSEGRGKFNAQPAQEAPTQQGKMETFARSWFGALSSLRESGEISEEEYSSVVREVAGSDWSIPETDEELVSRLVTDSEARHRALIDGSDEEVIEKNISSPSAASAHRVLYAIKTGLSLFRTYWGIRFVLIPPGTVASSLVNLAPFYLSETLLTQYDWNRIMGVPSKGSVEHEWAQTHLSPQSAQMLIEKAPDIAHEMELCLPTVAQWSFVVSIGPLGQPASLAGPRICCGKSSAFGLHDLLGVVWQICRLPDGYQCRGGSYLRRLRPVNQEPPAIPCDNTALCGEDVGLRLALVPRLHYTHYEKNSEGHL